ncbi:MAG: TrbC family F-type conjugative pilus assembly protein [Alphaproteobacteria bacterium]|nr:TrbC family F-type conjugative pilus assembly protein [Alphaproteobacteria bacterium]
MIHVLSTILLGFAMASPAWAQQAQSPEDLEAIGEAATILRQQGSSNPLLRDLANQAEAISQEQRMQSRPLALPKKGQLILFVSASMGDEGLRRAFLAASGDPDVTLVFRGALPGEKLTQLTRRLGELLEDIDPKPNVAIHPKSFRDHQVTLVPTIVEPPTGKIIRGTVRAETFHERAKGKTEMDLGTVGPTSDIIEPDLVELIRERIAEVDVETRAKESVASYWQRAPFIDVPKARARRVRRLDPAVTTTNDLRDHEARMIAPVGTRINPLAALPFTSRLLIFDGTDPAERQWARDHIQEDRKTILITTRIDRNVGWPAWKELHRSFGLPVYFLQAKIAERFALEATPTMIEAAHDGRTLLVTEDVPASSENPS